MTSCKACSGTACATYLFTPIVRHLAIRLGAVGEVRKRDVHTIPTPRMGGLAMLCGFLTAMLFASRLDFLQGVFRQNHQAWIVMAGAILICLLGIADDVWDLDWMLKHPAKLLITRRSCSWATRGQCCSAT